MFQLSSRFKQVLPHPVGAFRSTVIVQDRVLGGLCVLKSALADSPEGDQLRSEGALLSELDHPKLVRLVSRFHAVGAPWAPDEVISGLATRWVDGEKLTAALAKRPLEERMATGPNINVTAKGKAIMSTGAASS